MREVVPFLYLMHEMELIRRMMHSYTGTFLLMFLFVTLLGGSYIAYYQTVMKSSQRRLRMLEPGFLSIFVLDMGLIGFTRSAAKMLTQNCLVTFFFWKPERFQIQIFVAVGILMYPVLFVLVTCWMIWDVTIKDAGRSADETDEVEIHGDDLHTKMVFNEDIEQWIDPAAKEIKVTLEPPIPSWVLVASDALTSHVRSCIPVLTEKGEAISFKHEHQEKVKEAQHLNRANLEEERRTSWRRS
ncbi:unnamed protein product [Effrenium voratum]|nr:unnamed protein product [Effrenium voratum]